MADAPYLKHFGLKEEAFSPVPNPRFFFLAPTHAISMEKTRLTVQSGKGLSVVYGEHGTGKSSLARLLHAQFLEKGFHFCAAHKSELSHTIRPTQEVRPNCYPKPDAQGGASTP